VGEVTQVLSIWFGNGSVSSILDTLLRPGNDGALFVVASGAAGAFLFAVWKAVRERAEAQVKSLLESPRNLVAAIVFGLPLFAFLALRLWYAALAVACTALVCLLLRRHIEGRRNVVYGALAVQGVVVVVALVLNLRYLEEQARQYDVVFVLIPAGMPVATSGPIYSKLRDALRTTLQDAPRIRIEFDDVEPNSPDKVDYQNLSRLLRHRTKEGSPVQLAMQNRYNLASPHVRLSPHLHSRHQALERFVEIADWKREPIVSPEADLDIAALQATHRLMSFLGEKKLVRLTADEERQIWVNLLRELDQVLNVRDERYRPLLEEVRRVGAAGAPTAAEVERLLRRYQSEFGEPKGNTAAERDARTLGVRYGAGD
jgi:hypothetical protein